jgi:hypothetical protein
MSQLSREGSDPVVCGAGVVAATSTERGSLSGGSGTQTALTGPVAKPPKGGARATDRWVKRNQL